MTFSWSPPAPTLRNGVITGYTLSCVPEAGRRNTISKQYTTAGTFTLGGFTPATSYNCSISASNSLGSGPAVYMVVTTLDDGKRRMNYYEYHFISTKYIYVHTYIHLHSSSTLLSSNVVSVATEWDWSERLSGMGCKYTTS